MRRIATIAAIAVLVAAACGDDATPTTTTASTPLTGYVHAGPVCPVVQDPPDPNCADRPVAGAALRIVGVGGSEVALVTTAEDGTFSLPLPPGTYTLEPQPVDGLMGTAAAQSFDVGSSPVHLDVAYDTGIR